MTLTNEQIEQILDGAPDGSTHYCENGQYWRLLNNEWQVYESHHGNYFWVDEYPICLNWLKNLSDLRTIIAQADEIAAKDAEIERLKAQVPKWISVNERFPEICEMVLGFNSLWIDEDFNPKGVRECFSFGDGTEWVNAEWHDPHDCYETGYEAPTHWMPLPQTPKRQEHE